MELKEALIKPDFDPKTDLSIGHPRFMQEHWYLQQTFLGPDVENFSDRSFQYSSDNCPPLEKNIRLLHEKDRALGGKHMNIDASNFRLNFGCLEQEFQNLIQALESGVKD